MTPHPPTDSPAVRDGRAALDTAAELWVTASDGVPLLCRRYDPPGDVRGSVVFCPGVRSHSGWYGWSCRLLADAGWRVWFPDRRGSGANGPPRGDARHADRLLADVRAVLRLAAAADPGGPRVLGGVSWGAKVAATLAGERGACDGLLLLNPGLRGKVGGGVAAGLAARAAVACGLGAKPVRVPLADPHLFTGDPAFAEFVRADPLAIDTVTLRFAAASFDLGRRADRALKSLPVPVLCALAGRDAVIDNAATRRLLGRCGAPSVTVSEAPAARHTLEFEPDRAAIFAGVLRWLDGLRP